MTFYESVNLEEKNSMPSVIDMDSLNLNIRSARTAVEELKRLGEDFPAVARNAERILASLKMLEINVCDVMELGRTDNGDR
jgi:hypothetical protein